MKTNKLFKTFLYVLLSSSSSLESEESEQIRLSTLFDTLVQSNDAVKAKLLNKNKHIKYFNTSIFNIYPLLKLNIF